MNKPYVLVYATISVDAGLTIAGKKLVLSSDRDISRLHYLRSQVDAVMVGANTVIIDNPILTVRLPQFVGEQPYRVVVDRDLRTDPSYSVYDTSVAPSIVVTSIKNNGSYRLKKFIEKGVEVVFTDTLSDGSLNLEKALVELSNKYEIKKVLVQGGGFLIASLIKQRLVDELIVSITPLVLGLNKISLVNDTIEEPLSLKLAGVEIDHFSGEVIIRYKLS